MDREPLVDVVVATNRSSPFLRETLASVAAQTWARRRVTVVDDGSPDADGLRRLVGEAEGLGDARVLRQEPSGLAAARNTGVGATDGELLVFLDDDDVWAPTRLARQVESLASDPEASCSFTGGWYLDEAGEAFGDGWPAAPGTPDDMRALRVPLPRITTLMCRRSAVEAVRGFDPTFPASEDIAFVLALLGVGPAVPVDEPLVGYRRHRQNMTVTIPMARQLRLHDRAFGEALARALRAGRGDAAAALREGRARSRAEAASGALVRVRHGMRRGDVRGSLDDLAWSVGHAPGAVVGSVLRRLGRG